MSQLPKKLYCLKIFSPLKAQILEASAARTRLNVVHKVKIFNPGHTQLIYCGGQADKEKRISKMKTLLQLGHPENVVLTFSILFHATSP